MTKLLPGQFTKNVWRLALLIPPGRVTTYGYLAVAAGGHPMMARMITLILSKSPDVDLIPFHRIVYASGKVWLGSTKPDEVGLDPAYNKIRRQLYAKEKIKIDKNNKIINFKELVFTFD